MEGKINPWQGYEPLIRKEGLGSTQIAYSKDFPNVGLEDLCLEISHTVKGTSGKPLLRLSMETARHQ